jgi:hypothetical protein
VKTRATDGEFQAVVDELKRDAAGPLDAVQVPLHFPQQQRGVPLEQYTLALLHQHGLDPLLLREEIGHGLVGHRAVEVGVLQRVSGIGQGEARGVGTVLLDALP